MIAKDTLRLGLTVEALDHQIRAGNILQDMLNDCTAPVGCYE
ncbi:hypothetical protein ACWAUC_12615 [Bradyrhizobium guangdongense]